MQLRLCDKYLVCAAGREGTQHFLLPPPTFFRRTQSSFSTFQELTFEKKTHLCCWGSCCSQSPTAWWTGCCKWSLQSKTQHYRPLWARSAVSALSQDDYRLHCEVHQGSVSSCYTSRGGLSPTAGIISGDFPQREMIGWWVDNRVCLVISRTGSLNTDQPGPPKEAVVSELLFFYLLCITQCAPVKAPSFIAYSDS